MELDGGIEFEGRSILRVIRDVDSGLHLQMIQSELVRLEEQLESPSAKRQQIARASQIR